MSDSLIESTTGLRSRTGLGKIDVRHVAWFSLLVLAGGVAALFPEFWLYCLAAAAIFAVCWIGFAFLRRYDLEFWQVIALATLTGYLVLNYGFDNLAIHVAGFPILVAYGFIYVSLALAFWAHRQWVAQALREPAVLFLLGVLGLSFIHLFADIPAYGSLAFRDATMCFDGLFVVMGMLWARKSGSTHFLTRWLLVVFVLNMFYGFTLPWNERIWSWSPQSGAYLPTPLFGNFHGSGDILLAGAAFCICVGSYLIKRPAWLMDFLVLGQLLGIAIAQVRRMYLGIVLVVIILAVAGEVKKFAKLFILVPVSVAVIFVVTSMIGFQISGRIGEVNLDFFVDHLRSISGAENTPGSDPEGRIMMAKDTYQHILAHPIFGEGFGQPVVDVLDEETQTATRTPHDSSLTFLARLGAIGFLTWVGFHFCLWKGFLTAFRRRHSVDKRLYALILWLFLYYVLLMMSSFVEAPFEYPASAIPFYFFMGYALGLVRWQLVPRGENQSGGNGGASRARKAYA